MTETKTDLNQCFPSTEFQACFDPWCNENSYVYPRPRLAHAESLCKFEKSSPFPGGHSPFARACCSVSRVWSEFHLLPWTHSPWAVDNLQDM